MTYIPPNSNGQKTMANSTPVVLPSDQSAIPVTGTFWQATQPVSGTVTSNQGSANTVANAWFVKNSDGTNTAAVKAASTAPAATDPALTVTISPNSAVHPVTQSGTWTVQPGNTANTTPWLIAQQTAATAALTSVTAAATSTTVLVANTARKGAYFYNDSTAILYLAYAATASTTAYTLQVAPGAFYEMPEKPLYTGLITGVWSSAAGAVRVTELS